MISVVLPLARCNLLLTGHLVIYDKVISVNSLRPLTVVLVVLILHMMTFVIFCGVHVLYSGRAVNHPVHPLKVGVKDLHENLKVKAPTSTGGITMMKVLKSLFVRMFVVICMLYCVFCKHCSYNEVMRSH